MHFVCTMVPMCRHLSMWACLFVALGLLTRQAHSKGKGSGSAVPVKGYYRSDGTYVAPHMRSAPDGDPSNNWSTRGNVNPYTGEEGTKVFPSGAATTGGSPAISGESPPMPSSRTSPERPSTESYSGIKSTPSLRRAGGEISKRRGWQLIGHNPNGVILDQFNLISATAIACSRVDVWSKCRPINDENPLRDSETIATRASFFSAINVRTGLLEVWGFPGTVECEKEEMVVRENRGQDYEYPSTCSEIAISDLGAAWDRAHQPQRVVSQPNPANSDQNVVRELVAQQNKLLRVCNIVQEVGRRIDGLTTSEAAAIITRAIPTFSKDDFTQIAVRFGIVQCIEPRTQIVDNCAHGTILHYRKATCH